MSLGRSHHPCDKTRGMESVLAQAEGLAWLGTRDRTPGPEGVLRPNPDYLEACLGGCRGVPISVRAGTLAAAGGRGGVQLPSGEGAGIGPQL